MLSFALNNRPFLLDLKSSIRITCVNPACMFNDFPGDIGLGVNIPVNDNNRMLLGNPERFENYSTSTVREFENFDARFSGNHLMSGTLVILTANDESYSGWLRSNVGNMGKEHREKYIYDIEEFDQEITFENKANYDPLTDHYACPKIHNPDFFKDKGARKEYTRSIINPDWHEGSDEEMVMPETYERELISEAFRKGSYHIVNNLNPDNTLKLHSFLFGAPKLLDMLDISVVSPMLFLNYILEALFRDAHFYIDKSAIADHPDLQKLLLYNNFDITHMGFGTTQPISYNSPFHDEQTTKSLTFDISFIARNYDHPFKYKDLLPKLKLKDFILSIQNCLNVIFVFRRDGKVDIIDRESITSSTPTDITDYMLKGWSKEEQIDTTLKFKFNHDDKDTFFQERWTDIDDLRDNEKEAVENWNDLDDIVDPVLDEIRYINTGFGYAQYAWTQRVNIDPKTGREVSTDVLGWKFLALGWQNGFYNRGKDKEEIIQTSFSTLYINPISSNPFVNQQGNIQSNKFSYESFSPRLLFYKGNNLANFETENVSLDWEKPTSGLLDSRWPKWNRIWSKRQPMIGKAKLPFNVLDYSIRNIYKKFRCKEGEFVVEQLETPYSLHDIGTTTIKAFKL